jgi:hypothetical protein
MKPISVELSDRDQEVPESAVDRAPCDAEVRFQRVDERATRELDPFWKCGGGKRIHRHCPPVETIGQSLVEHLAEVRGRALDQLGLCLSAAHARVFGECGKSPHRVPRVLRGDSACFGRWAEAEEKSDPVMVVAAGRRRVSDAAVPAERFARLIAAPHDDARHHPTQELFAVFPVDRVGHHMRLELDERVRERRLPPVLGGRVVAAEAPAEVSGQRPEKMPEQFPHQVTCVRVPSAPCQEERLLEKTQTGLRWLGGAVPNRLTRRLDLDIDVAQERVGVFL